MILRKPYALLIKHFRLIHFILFGSILFTLIKVNPILGVFKELVESGNIKLIDKTSFVIYLLLFIIIIFNFLMFLLMKNKKKPSNFYLISTIYYTVFTVVLVVLNNAIVDLSKTAIINLQTSRGYNDIARIVFYPQYVFLLFSLIRAIGFDIKSFDFREDLQELNVSSEDNEEFEFVIGFDYRNILVKLRKRIRELRYYFLENTSVIIVLSIVFIVSIVGYSLYNREVKEKIYNEKQAFNAHGFRYSIINSYVTNVDHSGNKIQNDDHYLVVNLLIKNLLPTNEKLNLDNFNVLTSFDSLVPDKSMNNFFQDLGIKYSGELIRKENEYNRILAFKIKKHSSNNTYQLNVYNGNNFDKGINQVVEKYIKVKLNPKIASEYKVEKEIYLGTEVNLNKSTLKDSKINIIDYKIEDNHIYKYSYCYVEDDCKDINGVISADMKNKNNTLLVLDYNLSLDEKITYSENKNKSISFFDDFATLSYVINDQEYTSPAKVKNTDDYKDKMVLEVNAGIKKANKLSLVINIRNLKYIINLK